MSYAAEMCDIVESHAGEKLRFFVRADPDTRDQDVLYVRNDVEWTERKAEMVDEELLELFGKESYEANLGAGDVTQIIKVADQMVLFTGFIEDEIVVVGFERGIFGTLPAMVGEFREYMIDHDIEFTNLVGPPEE